MRSVNIYLVSMEKDKERRDNLGIEPDYTYAVDGSTINRDVLKNEGKLKTEIWDGKKGEIGCYLSHVHLLNKALTSDKMVLILEDDSKIEPDTLDKINKTLETAPDNFELLFVGYNYHEEYNTFKKVNYIHGTQSYIVNPKNITKEKIDKLFPMEGPYDVVLAKKFITYIVEPKIINLGKFGSVSNTQIN